MSLLHVLLALMAACVGFALVARRVKLPYPVVLVLGGMALAFIPGMPEIELDPEFALAFFLPPLLQVSAIRTDWAAFRTSLRPILLLAVGAVLFTALCIAAAVKLMIPGFPWAAAIALGAIVAPPDAVAAGAVLQKLRLPRRIVTVLEGESLINDATALVLYRFAVLATMAGTFSWSQAGLTFLVVAVGGALVGWAVGRLVVLASARLQDTLLETAASFIACYAAFFGAEALHLSGVIAVVMTGLVLGRAQNSLSARTRRESRAVWTFIEFVLNSLVFILIGLQLNGILDRLHDYPAWHLALLAVTLSLVLIVSRFVWLFPASWLPRQIPAVRRHDPMPPWGHITVLSWAGMRGVVSLAAALALPVTFPERDLLVFLSFAAILATLVVQGTSLEWLIRRLGVEEPRRAAMSIDEAAARTLVAHAALREMERRAEDLLAGAIAKDLLAEYRDRVRLLDGINQGAIAAERASRLDHRLHALRAGRARLLRHHAEDGVDEELMTRLVEELDLEELRLRRLLGAVDR
ncbi:Na+/H+ antiporter [Roseomonas sp. CECT 9278]|uniref:Na+/H+ antiporter n=1 Tax=Roseomonas sp. CECT 9278 TaxID=2845823 RepID=UPI001E3036CF|nr:Na+/H+ antiporter [Roseomonas sp. CECT 9278]CAH0210402.1 Sodium, potassium, lithium and rubidium/H(+) antiporter [Roseomonas sp. CECT 9278]